jgi:hypothetical protein
MSTLPTSSVTTYQSFIMYPAGVCESFPIDGMSMVVPEPQARPNEDIELMIYSSQIYLRVIMNEAHNQLYGGKFLRCLSFGITDLVQARAEVLTRTIPRRLPFM